METTSRRRFAHFALAAFQLCVALGLLYWALPLFFDPPILGNRLDVITHELRALAERSGQSRDLVDAAGHLRWLFARHFEGVFLVMGAAVALGISAIVTAWLATIGGRKAG